jgi:hypothetical protein
VVPRTFACENSRIQVKILIVHLVYLSLLFCLSSIDACNYHVTIFLTFCNSICSSCYSLEEILERYKIHAEEEAAVRKKAEQEKVSQNFHLFKGVDL